MYKVFFCVLSDGESESWDSKEEEHISKDNREGCIAYILEDTCNVSR